MEFATLGEALDHAGQMVIETCGAPKSLRQEIVVVTAASTILIKALMNEVRQSERKIRAGTRKADMTDEQRRKVALVHRKAMEFEARLLEETAARLEALVSRDRTAWLSRN